MAKKPETMKTAKNKAHDRAGAKKVLKKSKKGY